jgi:hypothetical protein
MIPLPANNGKLKLIQRRGAKIQRNAEMKKEFLQKATKATKTLPNRE